MVIVVVVVAVVVVVVATETRHRLAVSSEVAQGARPGSPRTHVQTGELSG